MLSRSFQAMGPIQCVLLVGLLANASTSLNLCSKFGVVFLYFQIMRIYLRDKIHPEMSIREVSNIGPVLRAISCEGADCEAN